MSKYIDADKIKWREEYQEYRCYNDIWREKVTRVYKRDIEEMPAADVAPVVHGHWIEELGDVISCRCSRCDHSYNLYEDDINGYPYCAWCGAKMDESVS